MAIGILLLLFSIAFYLFVPQSTPISLKLSGFEKIVMPQSDNCEATKRSVANAIFSETPPLMIENQLTLMNDIDLYPINKTFRANIQFKNVILKIQDTTNPKTVDLGIFPITNPVGISGELSSVHSAYLNSATSATPIVHSYYCDPKLTIPGDYLDYYPSPEAETIIVDSFLGLTDSVYLQVSGNLDVTPLGLNTTSKNLLFIIEFPPNADMAIMASPYSSSFSVWADQISSGSHLPYAVADFKEWSYRTIPKYKIEGAATRLEIYAPKGVLKIGNDADIPLDSPTTNSTQSLIFAPSIFNKTSTFRIKG